MKTTKLLNSRLVIIIIIVIFVNILANRYNFRLDFTADQRYTLSQATENILQKLDDPVTVTVYFTEDVEPEILQIRNQLKDLLVEYASASDGKLHYEFIDPTDDQDLQQRAQQAGIRPMQTNASDQNQIKIQRIYAGIVVQQGTRTEVIPQISTGSSIEYAISTSIKKMTATSKPSIGFLTGHGEMNINNLNAIKQNLSELYEIETFDLSDSTIFLEDFKTIVILAPRDTLPASHIQRLEDYMAGGGNLFFASNRVGQHSQTGQGITLGCGLEDWLMQKGFNINPEFLIDFNCGSVPGGEQQMGIMRVRQDVKFPFFPIIKNYSDHIITKGLAQMYLPFTATIDFTGDTSGVTYQPLAFSSSRSATRMPPVFFNLQQTWSKNDFPKSDLTVAALLSGQIFGEGQSKLIAISNGVFPQIAQVPSNLIFLINSIDWLSDDTGLIDLRNKGVVSRDLDEVSEGRIIFLKWLNFLLPIILIIAYGIIRSQHNRNIRIKRMEEGYV